MVEGSGHFQQKWRLPSTDSRRKRGEGARWLGRKMEAEGELNASRGAGGAGGEAGEEDGGEGD